MIRIALFLILTSYCLSACRQAGCTDPTAYTYSPDLDPDDSACAYPELSVDIRQTIGGNALEQGRFYAMDSFWVRIDFARFYLSEPEFTYSTLGNAFPDSSYFLAGPAQQLLDMGQLYGGTVTQLSFLLGIPEESNHPSQEEVDAFPPGSVLGGQTPVMFWDSTDGYIFVRIEGAVDYDGDGLGDQDLHYEIGTDVLLQAVTLSPYLRISSAKEVIEVDWDLANTLKGLDLRIEVYTDSRDSLRLAAVKIADNLPAAFSIRGR